MPSAVETKNISAAKQKSKTGSDGFAVSCAFLIAAAVAMLAAMLLTLNRGFNFADEGFGMVLYSNPSAFIIQSSYHLIESKLPHFCSDLDLHYRLLSIVWRIVGACALAWGAMSWARARLNVNDRLSHVALYAAAIAANLGAFAIFPRIQSYAGFTAVLLFVAAGLALSLEPAVKHRHFQLRDHAISLCAGLLSGLCFFVKPPASAEFILAFIVLYGLRAPKLIGSFVGGGVLSLLLYFGVFDQWSAWTHRIQTMVTASFADGDHDPKVVLTSTVAACKLLIIAACLVLPAFAASLIRSKKWRILAVALVAAGELAAVGFAHKFNEFWMTLPFSIAFMTVLMRVRYERTAKEVSTPDLIAALPGLLLLLVVPFAILLGSNAPVMWSVRTNLAPVLIITLVLVRACSKWQPLSSIAVAGVVVAYLTAMFVNGFFLHPFCSEYSIFQKNIPGPARTNLSNLLLDPYESRMATQVRDAVERAGYQPGDAVIPLDCRPGMVYALKGSYSGVAWLVPRWNHECDLTIDSVLKQRPKRLFVLVQETTDWGGISRDSLKHFESAGYSFPRDFRQILKYACGTNTNGYVYVLDRNGQQGKKAEELPIPILP